MPESISTANQFSLSGGTLGEVLVQSFEGLDINVEVTSNAVGNRVGGFQEQQPQPGPKSYGEPTFICPIIEGDTTLWDWWILMHPNGTQGIYTPEDLIFTFEKENSVFAEWQLKGAFPMQYSLSSASTEESALATETIQLCITSIERMV
ncbi:hypothetical protein H1P_2450009 [Hyella patelloides LEGE 07179]|uniref:Phage tail protein n=1 Tax=Hyella patelloides LEGE 07179 TaxID=945734 RepID=A0A563VRX6_9CYAN|nr:phage tail protein [Hyella patelloides]VEP14163.1 hypothetical protein H1P_2450009 [Hyella patelloides LEGE 07179]